MHVIRHFVLRCLFLLVTFLSKYLIEFFSRKLPYDYSSSLHKKCSFSREPTYPPCLKIFSLKQDRPLADPFMVCTLRWYCWLYLFHKHTELVRYILVALVLFLFLCQFFDPLFHFQQICNFFCLLSECPRGHPYFVSEVRISRFIFLLFSLFCT